MTPDIEALLALQTQDEGIAAIEEAIAAIEPKLLDLDRVKQVARDALDRSRAALESEEQKLRELQTRVSEHKRLHERNVHQMDAVRRTRDANAAIAQLEQARQILADEESEVQTRQRHLSELRNTIAAQEAALAELESSQADARQALSAERSALVGKRDEAMRARQGDASKVPGSLLAKYDRIRRRKTSRAIYPLRGQSCGNCDTAIPLQRRNGMLAGAIEVCEGCGVLLYAQPVPATP